MQNDLHSDGEKAAHAQAMIAWLANKDPDVWFEVTHHLRSDGAIPVLDWIVAQPACDRANAALVFWGCDPLGQIESDGAHAPAVLERLALLERVLRNWKKGFYRRSELAWDEDWRGRYRRCMVAARPGLKERFAIPNDLLGPISGRAPEVPAELKVDGNDELRRLLAGLGADVDSAAAGAPLGSIGRVYRPAWAQRVRSVFGLG